MNRNLASMHDQQSIFRSTNRIGARLMLIGAIALVATFLASAQDSGLQDKLAAVKQSMAENTQKLHQYQWVETTQLTLNGDQKPPQQDASTVPTGRFKRLPWGLHRNNQAVVD
jgi:hypothetical protein